MLKPGGYAYTFDVGGVRQEADTFTCHHCNRVVIVKAKCDPCDLGGMCRLCDKMICAPCVDRPCVPFMKKIAEEEERDRRFRCYEV